MSLEPGLISYAALASLALSVKKHRPTPPLAFMPSPTMARMTGWLLLAVALLLSLWRFGGPQGVVAWIGQTCVAGAVFVLMLSWRSRAAFTLAVVGFFVALPMASA
ncbi:DUF3325 family protein [Sphingobium sp. TCM1]|uniref:DUF3325 family protein n=1 Tax=Sphingobium sp. TCM1 TaxID=453246 RepID=UPI0007F4579C|nr:DUF3325 family protein [Sphingobium sp. TCM1]OAN54803.1 hypothetical protein A7Q26_22895 [Sphingobium sp. TCM1]